MTFAAQARLREDQTSGTTAHGLSSKVGFDGEAGPESSWAVAGLLVEDVAR